MHAGTSAQTHTIILEGFEPRGAAVKSRCLRPESLTALVLGSKLGISSHYLEGSCIKTLSMELDVNSLPSTPYILRGIWQPSLCARPTVEARAVLESCQDLQSGGSCLECKGCHTTWRQVLVNDEPSVPHVDCWAGTPLTRKPDGCGGLLLVSGVETLHSYPNPWDTMRGSCC